MSFSMAAFLRTAGSSVLARTCHKNATQSVLCHFSLNRPDPPQKLKMTIVSFSKLQIPLSTPSISFAIKVRQSLLTFAITVALSCYSVIGGSPLVWSNGRPKTLHNGNIYPQRVKWGSTLKTEVNLGPCTPSHRLKLPTTDCTHSVYCHMSLLY